LKKEEAKNLKDDTEYMTNVALYHFGSDVTDFEVAEELMLIIQNTAFGRYKTDLVKTMVSIFYDSTYALYLRLTIIYVIFYLVPLYFFIFGPELKTTIKGYC
jgi:hypothetical protein